MQLGRLMKNELFQFPVPPFKDVKPGEVFIVLNGPENDEREVRSIGILAGDKICCQLKADAGDVILIPRLSTFAVRKITNLSEVIRLQLVIAIGRGG